MAKGSIAARLFWLSLAWLVVALIATAFLLAALYSRALDRSLAEALNFNLETLVARTLENGAPDAPGLSAADPRFTRPASGWYWQIADEVGLPMNLSNSLLGSVMPKVSGPFSERNARTGIAVDDFGTRIRLIERKVTIGDQELIYSVAGNLDEIAALTGQFRGQALVVLGAVGAMLAIMSAIVARVALRPVGKLSRAIENVRSGGTRRVEGKFPRELVPLADELNELLRANTEIVERAKNQVGNLAHGLKTPLAVLRNEAADKEDGFAQVVRTEIEKMNNQVKTYLDRAQMSARTSVIGHKTDAGAIVERLTRVMEKIHSDRDIGLDLPADGAPWFRGEESDLEEMVGNLLDNACKWSKSSVDISVEKIEISGQKKVLIAINDDGRGLNGAEMRAVLRRGVRLDEKTPGSGLGLDIVKELVDIYGGSLSLGASVKGGLEVRLILPAVGV